VKDRFYAKHNGVVGGAYPIGVVWLSNIGHSQHQRCCIIVTLLLADFLLASQV